MTLKVLQNEIVSCERCARLRQHCAEVARVKRRAYRDETYWGRPVPSFGDFKARLLIVGLAPGAHGANRTGRMFTGDKSGDFLYRSLYRAGFASQPESRAKDDGLVLTDAFITAAAHCAPPDNKPAPEEFRNCRPYLETEISLLKKVVVVVALGQIAFQAYLSVVGARPSHYAFGHGAEYRMPNGVMLIASYHPSQQNTSTGRLTQEMLDGIFLRARKLLRAPTRG